MPDAPEHITEATPAAFPLPPMLAQLPAMETPATAIDAPATAKEKPRRKRQHVEQFRTDDAEHAALDERAREAGLSIGAYVRACALGDAGPRARKRPPVDRELLARANADLNRVGNNLNQIAHALNSGDEVLRAAHVRLILELREILAELRRALGYVRQG
jgi:hypothetical protein